MSSQWFCRIMGDVWGPMSAMELFAVARRGRLTRDDVVRNGTDGDWVRAETVFGLFDGAAPAGGSRRIEFPARRSQATLTRRETPMRAKARYWVRHKAETAGPFSDRQILRLAATGKLKPEYLLSHDQERWHRVADVKALALAEA